MTAKKFSHHMERISRKIEKAEKRFENLMREAEVFVSELHGICAEADDVFKELAKK